MNTSVKRRYIYSLTAHDIEDLLDRVEWMGQPAGGPTVFYCDTDGHCVLDEKDDAYLTALGEMLNEEASQGKRLRQLILREERMIAIWEEKVEEA